MSGANLIYNYWKISLTKCSEKVLLSLCSLAASYCRHFPPTKSSRIPCNRSSQDLGNKRGRSPRYSSRPSSCSRLPGRTSAALATGPVYGDNTECNSPAAYLSRIHGIAAFDEAVLDIFARILANILSTHIECRCLYDNICVSLA